MRRRLALIPTIALLVGCADLFGPAFNAPPGTRAIVPPAEYATWWAEVERCSGRSRRMAEITFYIVPGVGAYEYRGQTGSGSFVPPAAIMLAEGVSMVGPFVKRIMLTAMGGTAADIKRCGDEVYQGGAIAEVR